jgi:hypothetical protein
VKIHGCMSPLLTTSPPPRITPSNNSFIWPGAPPNPSPPANSFADRLRQQLAPALLRILRQIRSCGPILLLRRLTHFIVSLHHSQFRYPAQRQRQYALTPLLRRIKSALRQYCQYSRQLLSANLTSTYLHSIPT